MLTGLQLIKDLEKLGVTLRIDAPRRQQRKSGKLGDDSTFTDYVLTYGHDIEIVSMQQAIDPHTLHSHLMMKARELVVAAGGAAIPRFE